MAMAAAPFSLETAKDTLCVCSWCETDGNSSLRLLPCLHNVCRTCLSKCVTGNKIGPGDKFSCRFCEQCFTMPATGITGFSINTLANSLHFLTQLEDDITCDACCNMNVKQQADAKCVDCDELLCDKCLLQHKGAKLTSMHCVLTVDEIKADIDNYCNIRAKKYTSLCPIHPTERLTYFCKPCGLPICGDCKIIKHDPHPSMYLEEAASNGDACLEELSVHLNVITLDHKSQSDDLKSKVTKSTRNYNKLVTRIKKTADQALQDIEKQSRSLQNAAHATYQKSAENPNESIKVTESRIAQLAALLDNLTHLRIRSSDIEKAELCTNLKLQHIEPDNPSSTNKINDTIDMMKFTENKNVCKQLLGDIIESKPVQNTTTVDLPPVPKNKSIVTLALHKSFSTKLSSDSNSPLLSGVAVYMDDIIVVDSANKILKRFNAHGKSLASLKAPDRIGPGTPKNVTIVSDMIVVKCGNHQVQVFDCKDNEYLCFGYPYRSQTGIATISDTEAIYFNVAEAAIYSFHSERPFAYPLHTELFKIPEIVQHVAYMAYSIKNVVFLVDPKTQSVYFVDMKGTLLLHYHPESLQEPAGVCVDKQGNFYIADTKGDCIHKVDHTLSEMEVIGSEVDIHGPIALAYHNTLDGIVLTQKNGEIKVLKKC